MPGISLFFIKRWCNLILPLLLLATLVHNLQAQNVPTFELTISGTSGINNLQAIPGTNEFYAVSQGPVVMKLDTAGNIIRQTQYALPRFGSITQARVKADGGLVLLGAYSAYGEDTVYCLSLNPSGTVAWYKSFYLGGQPLSGFDIIETDHGDFVISGSIARENFLHDAFLLKLDAGGNPIWMKCFNYTVEMDAFGGGIIQKKDTIIFCSTVAPFGSPRDIRLSKVLLIDGSLLSVTDLMPGGYGLYLLRIYDDLNGGYYIRAPAYTYRDPCQAAYTLRLDNNIQLIGNYQVRSPRIPQGFGVLSDGTLTASYPCNGPGTSAASSTLTKVSTSGEVVFSAHYPGYPFLQIFTAVSVGNQVFAAGIKNGKGFITALNNFRLSQNNCSLITNDAKLERDVFTTVAGEWASITNGTVVATNLPVELINLSLTTELVSCIVPSVLYVDQQATGQNNGSSWKNAFTSLTAAINKMNVTMGVDSILVAAGTYTSNPNATFVFNKLSSVILGGYPTGGGSRNAAVNVVVLQGLVRFEKSVRFDGFNLQ
ncbi:MAG: hypothetical protein V4717_24355 [Bacteroidota bacterium]